MKKPINLYSFLIFSLLIIISSCGGGNSVAKKSFGIDALLGEERLLNNEERNIATRICYAFQSKSKNFRTSEFLGSHFIFSGKTTDCQKTETSYQINSTLKYNDSNELIYETLNADSNLRFNRKVQTDTSGYLSVVCSKIIKNEPISNTISQSGLKVQISFFRENLDAFLLMYFVKQTDNTYKIDSAEKLKIRSLNDFTSGKILGMDEAYTNQKICGSQYDKNKQFSEFEQNFVTRLAL